MNERVLNSLSNAEKVTSAEAQLIIASTGNPITFLYNPESISWSRKAVYTEAATAGTGISEQNYIRSSGRVLELPNLLLDSFCAGKSLRQLIEGIESLLLPAAPTKAPETVYFSWGTELFGPAVLTSMSVNETLWLGGEPAQARVDLSLTQLPQPVSPVASTPTPTAEVNLTERQREDARKAADNFLSENVDRLRTEVRSAFNSDRFSYLTTEKGLVSIEDAQGRLLGSAGSWDGYTFSALEELLT